MLSGSFKWFRSKKPHERNHIMSINRNTVNSLIGNDLILWINPKYITHYVGKNIKYLSYSDQIFRYLPKYNQFIKRTITKYSSFVISKKNYNFPVPINNMDKYLRLDNFIKNKHQFRESDWYDEMLLSIKNNRYVKYKKIVIDNEDKLDNFFTEYVLDLVNSMEIGGYDIKKNKQIGYVMIGEDGSLHKSNAGEHRLFVAKILGVKSVPVRVKGIHESWLKKQGIVCDKKNIYKILSSIKELENKNK